MNKSKKKILFISHEATRTGAPILFLQLILEISKLQIYDIEIILLNDGPLKKDFVAIAPTWILKQSYSQTVRKVLKKLLLYSFTYDCKYEKKIKAKVDRANIIFANTVASYFFLRDRDLENKSIFFYVHELSYSIQRMFSHQDMNLINKISNKIFVPAHFVKDFLIETYNYDREKIKILKYVIPYNVYKKEKSNFIRNTFVVGACGNFTLRKGFDLFGLIVREIIITRKITDIKFLWIGIDYKNLEELLTFQSDLKKLGITSFVELINSTGNIIEIIRQLDVLLLTSREDAYPLVVMEAASQGIPSIYFDGAGGIGEFVRDGGICVPYLDLNAYTDAILKVKDDSGLLKTLGKNAIRNFVQEKQEFNVENLLSEIEH